MNGVKLCENDENILEVEQNFTVLNHVEINDSAENFKINWKCSKKCCSVLHLNRTDAVFLNQIYFKNGTFVNDRPLYVGFDQRYGIWFDGGEKWIVGLLASINKGLFRLGYLRTSKSVNCPNNSELWQEYSEGNWRYWDEFPINFSCQG